MNFSEKLQSLRKRSGLSQEQLAEKLNVSRQAVTKWETGGGVPDISNLVAIGKLFDVSLDELIDPDRETRGTSNFFYKSVTEYDILTAQPFDIHIGGAKEITLDIKEGAKARILLASNSISTLADDFKVALDGNDIDVKPRGDITEARAKEALHVFISLPGDYLAHTELEASARTLRICGFNSKTLEFDGKVSHVFVEDSNANIELNSSTDMEVTYNTFAGRLEINQVHSTSILNIPCDSAYSVKKKGISTAISFSRDGKALKKEPPKKSDNIIEFKGIHAELVINEYTSLVERRGDE